MNRRGPIVPGAPLVTAPRPVAPFVPAFAPSAPRTAPQSVSQPVSTATAKGESAIMSVPFPANGVEHSVWKSQHPWSGCDVFVQLETPIDPNVGFVRFRVCIYAISQGSRVLVASGWARSQTDLGPQTELDNEWIAGSRNACSRWEVTVTAFYLGVGFIPGAMTVTCSTADDLPEVPPSVGKIPILPLANAVSDLNLAQFCNVSAIPFVELAAVQAVNGTANPLWLMLFDTIASSAPAGNPLMIWSVPANDGIDYAVNARMVNNVRLVLSSTFLVPTIAPPASGLIQAFVR